jgi:hypothetical protein
VERAHIDISTDLDGEPVVHACFDLAPLELAATAHAISADIEERFRSAELSGDDVVEFRELTALADELSDSGNVGARTLVFRPARLATFRDALARFVDSREAAEWIRDEDREPLAISRELLPALDQLASEAMHAALSPGTRHC